MAGKIITGAAFLAWLASLAGCGTTTPEQLCRSPLVRVNALAPVPNVNPSVAGTNHE